MKLSESYWAAFFIRLKLEKLINKHVLRDCMKILTKSMTSVNVRQWLNAKKNVLWLIEYDNIVCFLHISPSKRVFSADANQHVDFEVSTKPYYDLMSSFPDKVIRHRACSLKDTAHAIFAAELDPEFDRMCEEIKEARRKRSKIFVHIEMFVHP